MPLGLEDVVIFLACQSIHLAGFLEQSHEVVAHLLVRRQTDQRLERIKHKIGSFRLRLFIRDLFFQIIMMVKFMRQSLEIFNNLLPISFRNFRILALNQGVKFLLERLLINRLIVFSFHQDVTICFVVEFLDIFKQSFGFESLDFIA